MQVIAKAGITHRNGFSAKPPTVMLQFNKDFEVGSDGVSDKKHPDSLSAGSPARAGGLVSLSLTIACCLLYIGLVACSLLYNTLVAAECRRITPVASNFSHDTPAASKFTCCLLHITATCQVAAVLMYLMHSTVLAAH